MNDLCRKVNGAYCRPGMRGCVLFGKVTFQDGQIPSPIWPPGAHPRDRAPGDTGRPDGEAPTGGTP